MHTDTGTAGGHHGRGLGERALGGLLEELGVDGVVLELGGAHVEELGGARHEHGKHPLLLVGVVLPVVFEKTHVGEVVEHGLELLGGDAVALTAASSV